MCVCVLPLLNPSEPTDKPGANRRLETLKPYLMSYYCEHCTMSVNLSKARVRTPVTVSEYSSKYGSEELYSYSYTGLSLYPQ